MEWFILIIFIILMIIVLNIVINYIAKNNNCYEIYRSISDYEVKGVETIIMLFFVVICTLIVVLSGILKHKILTIIYFSSIAILGGTVPNLIKLRVAIKKKKNGEFVDTSMSGIEKDKIYKKQKREELSIIAFLLLLLSGRNKKK